MKQITIILKLLFSQSVFAQIVTGHYTADAADISSTRFKGKFLWLEISIQIMKSYNINATATVNNNKYILYAWNGHEDKYQFYKKTLVYI